MVLESRSLRSRGHQGHAPPKAPKDAPSQLFQLLELVVLVLGLWHVTAASACLHTAFPSVSHVLSPVSQSSDLGPTLNPNGSHLEVPDFTPAKTLFPHIHRLQG